MSLDRYWPTRDEINLCIKAEAESAPDAVLLAVHQPMVLVRRDEGSGIESQVSEHELLEAFLSDDLPQGTLLMPITGPSGAGKSHLIRWLAAQLGRDPRARNMHVIRIPKSASLRNVVERILEPLCGNERFAGLRESLDSAISQITPFEAAVRFSGALEIELTDLRNRQVAALRDHPSESERRTLQTRANHAARIPGLLNDDALREYMTNQVLAPVVQRAVKGRAEPAPNEEESLPQFCAGDLKIPDELRTALGQASRSVQTYYQTGLNRGDGAGYEDAAKVLNLVVDRAIQRVFQLDQATGGVTLESIILSVRELLLEQNRELVLLVEDFAALSGIQQVLLDVCIQQAEDEGRQVCSRMRTALALTDGYLDSRDTISTRARHEWRIKPESGHDDILNRTIELAGAYLNAARWGQQALQEAYKHSSHNSEASLTEWVEIFEDETLAPEDGDRLSAFGHNRRGMPLFPYNPPAIAELAKRHLRTSGELRFNPRRIINFILRDILLSGRDDFARDQFPPAGFQDAQASALLDSWLSDEFTSEYDRQRMKAFLVYWGGNPANPEQAAQVAPYLFAAFALKRPGALAEPRKRPVQPQRKTPPGTKPAKTTSTRPKPTPEIDKWRQRLDDWSSGTSLQQAEARRLRNILMPLVEKAIPWNLLRLKQHKLSLLLQIPNAPGNEAPAGIYVAIAEDHRDPYGQLRQALLAAVRLDESKGKLDYPEADEDSARVSTLIERLVADVLPHLERQRVQEVRVLSWLLRRQARALGLVTGARMPQFDTEVHAVRQREPEPSPSYAEQAISTNRWQQLRREAADLRPALRQALTERIGCFQGTTGKTVFAMDPTLIDVTAQPDGLDPRFLDRTQREHLAQLKSRIAPATRPLLEQLHKLVAQVDALLGPEREKKHLISALPTLFEALAKVGAWPDGYEPRRLRTQLTAFGQVDLIAQLRQAEPLLAVGEKIDLTADTTLERLGRLDLKAIEAAQTFLAQVETFVSAAERKMDTRENSLSGIDPDQDAKDLEHDLKQIGRDLHSITGESDT